MNAEKRCLAYTLLQLAALLPTSVLLAVSILQEEALIESPFLAAMSLASTVLAFNAHMISRHQGLEAPPLWLHGLSYVVTTLLAIIGTGGFQAVSMGYLVYVSLSAGRQTSCRLNVEDPDGLWPAAAAYAIMAIILILAGLFDLDGLAAPLFAYVALGPLAEQRALTLCCGLQKGWSRFAVVAVLYLLQPALLALAAVNPLLLVYSFLAFALWKRRHGAALDYIGRAAIVAFIAGTGWLYCIVPGLRH